MNKNIKQLMESLFDEETDNILASDKDSIDTVFAEKITGITIGKDHIIYEAVDLDLPSGNLWCDRNIGASTPLKIGGYFPRKSFSVSRISPNKSKNINLVTYLDLLNKRPKGCKTIPEFILGHGWDIPTKDNIDELINNTKVEPIQNKNNCIIAYKLISLKNANKFIIIPSSGYIKIHNLYDKKDAMFWSSTAITNYDCNYCFYIHDKFNISLSAADLLSSLPIRAIRKK